MTKTLSAATFALALTVPALAFALDADTDGDGMVSMEEFQAAMPDAPAGTFEQLDSDADGMLSEAEVAAGQEAGILPA
ncbi:MULTISPECIES: EF-hand domain-containing protein [Roseovarius]|uniref:EF-hand domain-containing protein n=1 Tax=Roseovarius TaxID=74030 RepID=UPI001C96885B|nr:EF-hand domain-containing protein [Roseovarius atlanticus]MBY5987367.1 EF-hand domain-containing protein [Roseovarius atlanticus]MBY6126007.1 EF-hand domain-containing protein [Roseovarius atlanticus]MBY6149533.1 EF-hand domain-containing protein [Roseovarius atlanticus]